MKLVDADELRRRMVESLDYHDSESSVDMDGWRACLTIIDAMPPAACETCKRLHMCGVLAAAYKSFTDIHEVEDDFACNRHEQEAKP